MGMEKCHSTAHVPHLEWNGNRDEETESVQEQALVEEVELGNETRALTILSLVFQSNGILSTCRTV